MDIRKLNDEYSVSGQLEPKDMAVIAALGFKSIICNRPDGEESSQASFEVVEAEAHNSGVRAVYIPVDPSGPTASDTVQFTTAFSEVPKPVLAYCRTGGRSQAIWAASQAGQTH